MNLNTRAATGKNMPSKSITKRDTTAEKTAAFFDFDGTVIAGYSAFYLLK
jgi:hypothetical protein